MQLGLIPPPEEFHGQHPLIVILKMTWAIILLPADKFNDAINAIEIEARQINNNNNGQYENMILFVEHLRRQWLPVANKISVNNSERRLNAVTEAVNGQLFRALGGASPRLVPFLGKYIVIHS